MARGKRKKSAREIVEGAMPNMEVVEPTPAAAPDDGARTTPPARPGHSVADLRRKYLRGAAEAQDASREPTPADDDVEVKRVRPKKTPSDPADDPGPRAVIISKKDGIVGAQG